MARKPASSSKSQSELERQLDELRRENEQLRNTPDNYGIPLDSYIEVMSLVPHKLNLSTEELGRGRRFSFKRFGEIKRILYNDLASILEHYHSFMENGLFYILDKRVIRKHGLDDVYAKILDKETIEKVLACESPTVVKLYEGASKDQRAVIDQMLIDKLKSGEDLDLNFVSKIGRIAEKDFVKLTEDAKFIDSLSVAPQ